MKENNTVKILYLINSLNVGGAEVLVLLAVKRMRSLGFSVDVAVVGPGHSSMEKRFAAEDVSVINFSGVFKLLKILKFIKKNKYTILHSHLFPSLLFGVVAKIMLKVKHVFTEHNTTNNRRRWYLWPFDVAMYFGVDKIVCISHGVAESLVRWNPYAKSKVVVIYNAIEYSRCRDLERIPIWRGRLLTVGRLVEDKNISLQIEMLKVMKKIHLEVVGDGPLKNSLKNLAINYDVQDRVRFLGVIDNLSEIYKEYDAYIHTANVEGFGLVIAEAMSAGLPVIAPSLAGLAEVAGDAALQFKPNNLEELCEKITQLSDASCSVLKEFSEKSILQSRKFSIHSHVESVLDLYGSLEK